MNFSTLKNIRRLCRIIFYDCTSWSDQFSTQHREKWKYTRDNNGKSQASIRRSRCHARQRLDVVLESKWIPLRETAIKLTKTVPRCRTVFAKARFESWNWGVISTSLCESLCIYIYRSVPELEPSAIFITSTREFFLPLRIIRVFRPSVEPSRSYSPTSSVWSSHFSPGLPGDFRVSRHYVVDTRWRTSWRIWIHIVDMST